MTSLQERAIESKAVEKVRVCFHGALLRPGEEGYEEARRIWNGAIDRRLALVARCAGTDVVMKDVRFAQGRDLLVSVRGRACSCIPSCLTALYNAAGLASLAF